MSLIEACNRDDTRTEELIEIISTDPGLIARLMDVMASASININREIRSIETAVVYLGMNAIRNLAISMAVMQVFDKPVKIPGWNINMFWYHSFASAVIAKKLAEYSGEANPDEAFLAGLMHDIGLLFFLSLFPDQYSSILAENNSEQDIIAAEKDQFGTTRFEAGSWLCKQWSFKHLICDAVANMNECKTNMASSCAPLDRIVFAAHKLTDFNYNEVGAKLFSMFGMDKKDAIQCLFGAKKEGYFV
jgi:HD-like signal output (HDOD) protein